MGDHVESLREVNRHGHRSVWWPGLIKARGHSVCEGKECCCSVVICSKAVLCWGKREGVEFWEEESLEDFDRWT